MITTPQFELLSSGALLGAAAGGMFSGGWLTTVGWILGVILLLVLLVGFVLWQRRRKWAILLFLAKHPFAKYVVLSVVVHVALAAWLFISHTNREPQGPGPAAVVVHLGAELGESKSNSTPEPKPWDAPPVDAVAAPAPELPPQETVEPAERPQQVIAEDPRIDSPLAGIGSFTDPSVAIPGEEKRPWDAPAETAMTAAAVSSTTPPAEQQETPDLFAQEESPKEFEQPDSSMTAQQETTPQDEQFPFSKNDAQQMPTLDEQPASTQEAEALASEQDSRFSDNRFSDNRIQEVSTQPVLKQAEPDIDRRLAPIQASASIQNPTQDSFETSNSFNANRRNELPSSTSASRQPPAPPSRTDGRAIPSIYRDRWASDRFEIARSRGGGEDTERAVQAALAWLAEAQAADGGWDASQFGSGKPTFEGGHDRRGAGTNADTGITGLSVLAFLGAGHTHTDGEYAEVVRKGLDYIASSQRDNGDLAGDAHTYAAMYCHGIASLALSEAYSLTGDSELLPSVQNAIRHTIAMQHPTTGGWRYRRGQEGDTSQLGWQLMALTSAHYAGLQIPRETWLGAGNYLRSVTSNDGRSSYRPGQLPSRAMTAEAMLCKLFLRAPPSDRQIKSAARYVVTSLPGNGRVNYYYWYYGTLALYHLQDHNWERWNTAVKRTLVGRQQSDGSWSADSVWGTSGGKVYSTALGALTLEVYYRYRPLANPVPTRGSEQTARRGR